MANVVSQVSTSVAQAQVPVTVSLGFTQMETNDTMHDSFFETPVHMYVTSLTVNITANMARSTASLIHHINSGCSQHMTLIRGSFMQYAVLNTLIPIYLA